MESHLITGICHLRNELIYCTRDIDVNPVGGSFESGLNSPVNLQASTFSDELEMATNQAAKVFGIGLKDNSAILSTGHSADGVFWFDNTTGTWMTSTYYSNTLPGWVMDFNAMKLSGILPQWNLESFPAMTGLCRLSA